MSLQREVLVYPRIEPTDEMFEILPRVRGEWESFVRGRGSELYSIREYQPEDTARHVDWKATAKSGSLKVREFAREDERKLCIVFDNPEAGVISDQAYERGVNMAASLAWHFSEQEADVSFVVPGRGRSADLHEFLSRLAVIEPVGEARGRMTLATNRSDAAGKIHLQAPSLPALNLSELNLDNTGEFHIVLTARTRESLPASLWDRSYVVFLGGESALGANFKQ